MPFGSSQIHSPGPSQGQQMIQQMAPNGTSTPGYPGHLVTASGSNLPGQIGHRVPLCGPPAAPQEPLKPMNHRIKVEVVNTASRTSGGYRLAQVVTNRQGHPHNVRFAVDIPTPSRQQVSSSGKHPSPPRAQVPQKKSNLPQSCS